MRPPLPRTRRGWILAGVVGAVVALAVGGAIWFDRYYPWRHFRTVVPGAVYRAGQPTAENVRLAVDRYGIKTLVNLRAERGPWLEEERTAAEQAGIRFVDLPIPEGQPPTPEQVGTLLALHDDPARRPLLYHCQYGSIRSAGVEALFRMEVLGESNAQALENARTYGSDLAKRYPAIAEFIRTYVPRRVPAGESPKGGSTRGAPGAR
jgi:protein tyrosine/serine phosphatase